MAFDPRIAVAAVVLLTAASSTFAKEPVGEAIRIQTAVTGDYGPIVVKSPVHRNERIITSRTGLGQFVFNDGTKLAVGAGSSVVIDKFVFDDRKSVRKLGIKAAKGTFRWISGNSRSTAYEIVTPSGTLGVRGTAFDFYVGRDGTTAVVLLEGYARFCGRNGCRELDRSCESVVATPARGLSDPEQVNRDIFRTLRNPRALPFLSGEQRLGRQFRVGRGGCGLSAAAVRDYEREKPAREIAPREAPPDPPDPPEPKDKNPNNGKGNGGDDGSPNGKSDKGR